MRSFNKLANLHRVFFKRAQETWQLGQSGQSTTKAPLPVNNRPALPSFGSNSMLYTPGMAQFPVPSNDGPSRAQHSSGFKVNNKPSSENNQFTTHNGQGLTPKPVGPRPARPVPAYNRTQKGTPEESAEAWLRDFRESDGFDEQESRLLHKRTIDAMAHPHGRPGPGGIVNPTGAPLPVNLQ